MLDILSTSLALLMAAGAAILFMYTRRSRQRQLYRIPTPPTWPVLGVLMELFCPVEKLFMKTYEWSVEFGPIVFVWVIGGVEVVMLSGPNEIQAILSNQKNLTKGSAYNFLNSWLAKGLLNSTGPKWRSRRKMLNPAFHFKILENFVPTFNKNSAILISNLREHQEKKHVEIEEFVTLCALDNLCETVMGASVNAQKGEGVPYIRAVKRMCQLFTTRNMKPWLYSDLLWRLSPYWKEEKEALTILKGFSGKIIAEKRAGRKQRALPQELDDSEDKKRLSLLDLMLEMTDEGVELSDEDIRQEVDTFMFAGHDTTSTAICWVLTLLANHPKVQEKLAAELSGIFGSEDREPSTADLSNMTYMDQVIKEAMRMFPSVPSMTRKLETDLKIGEYWVPAGTDILVMPFHLHRNPEIYPEPDKFDPERFSPDQMAKRHAYAYIPFSAGPRNCIGQKFARLEQKCLLSAIIRNFRLEPGTLLKDIVVKQDIVLKPVNPLKVKLSPRT